VDRDRPQRFDQCDQLVVVEVRVLAREPGDDASGGRYARAEEPQVALEVGRLALGAFRVAGRGQLLLQLVGEADGVHRVALLSGASGPTVRCSLP
jgi:hypothetical protein